jgi:hypothetical protein
LPKEVDNLNFDLKIGFEKFENFNNSRKYIDNLLEWMIDNKDKILLENAIHKQEK